MTIPVDRGIERSNKSEFVEEMICGFGGLF